MFFCGPIKFFKSHWPKISHVSRLVASQCRMARGVFKNPLIDVLFLWEIGDIPCMKGFPDDREEGDFPRDLVCSRHNFHGNRNRTVGKKHESSNRASFSTNSRRSNEPAVNREDSLRGNSSLSGQRFRIADTGVGNFDGNSVPSRVADSLPRETSDTLFGNNRQLEACHGNSCGERGMNKKLC